MLRFNRVASLFTSALIGALYLAGSTQDELLYYSDGYSLAYIVLGLAFTLFLAMLGLAAVWVRVCPAVAKSGSVVADWLPVPLILMSFVVYAYEWLERPISSPSAFWAASGTVFVAGYLLLLLVPRDAGLWGRLARFTRATSVCGLLAFVGCCTVAYAPRVRRSVSERGSPHHALLIVIDGMPTSVLHSYNPDAPVTGLDRVMSQGLLFKEARTNKVYTLGYFKALLTGQLDEGFKPNRPNLLRSLQDQGVKARWMAFHENGIPETNRITDYLGLRSALLTENVAWFPSLLGLDYHVFLRWDGTRSYMNRRINWLYTYFYGRTDEDYLWDHELPRQVAELRSSTDRSLLIVHVSADKNSVQAKESGDFHGKFSELLGLYARAKSSDYTYGADDEHLMRLVREEYRLRADAYGERITRLLQTLVQSGAAKDTLVIVTADHGCALYHNRIWYGFHPDEQVARVPLALFGPVDAGQSATVVDTLDLGHTLATYLGADSKFARPGRSLMGPLPERTIPVLTLPSSVRAEQFLDLYSQGRKYLFNVLPGGDGRVEVGVLTGYEQVTTAEPLSDVDPIWHDFGVFARAMGLTPAGVHERFRPKLQQDYEKGPQ